MIHTGKRFSIVNETEADVSWNSLAFFMIQQFIGNLISGSSAFSKPSLYIWRFLIQVLLKLSLKDFEHNLTSRGSEYNSLVV